MTELIGIDNMASQVLECSGDKRLAGSVTSGEADFQHEAASIVPDTAFGQTDCVRH